MTTQRPNESKRTAEILDSVQVTLPLERKGTKPFLNTVSVTSPRRFQRYNEQRVARSAVVKVSEARGLPGNIGTFCEICVEDRKIARTMTKWNETNPFWGDEVKIELGANESHVIVNLWRDVKSKKGVKSGAKSIPPEGIKFIGTTLRLELCTLEQESSQEGWYRVYYCNKSKKQREKPLEYEIRLAIKYEEAIILPSHSYEEFVEYLLESKFKVISILSEVNEIKPKARVEMAETMAIIAEAKGKAPSMLSNIIVKEIERTKTKQVLFRGNSIGTKCFDFYMKLVGQHWLKKLKPFIEMVKWSDSLSTRLSCEIVASKLGPTDKVEENVKLLETLLTKTADIIFNTVNECPLGMRKIFATMNKAVKKQFPGDDEVLYTAISGFIFLRFFVPAVMTPKLFGLMDSFVEGNVNRTFVLVATVLQKLGNLQEFESREAHLDKLNPFIKKNLSRLKEFIDTLCKLPRDENPHSDLDRAAADIDLDRAAAQLARVLSSDVHIAFLEQCADEKITAFITCLRRIADEHAAAALRRREERELQNQTPNYYAEDSPSPTDSPSKNRSPNLSDQEFDYEDDVGVTGNGGDIDVPYDNDQLSGDEGTGYTDGKVRSNRSNTDPDPPRERTKAMGDRRSTRERSTENRRKKRVSRGQTKPSVKRHSRTKKKQLLNSDEPEESGISPRDGSGKIPRKDPKRSLTSPKLRYESDTKNSYKPTSTPPPSPRSTSPSPPISIPSSPSSSPRPLSPARLPSPSSTTAAAAGPTAPPTSLPRNPSPPPRPTTTPPALSLLPQLLNAPSPSSQSVTDSLLQTTVSNPEIVSPLPVVSQIAAVTLPPPATAPPSISMSVQEKEIPKKTPPSSPSVSGHTRNESRSSSSTPSLSPLRYESEPDMDVDDAEGNDTDSDVDNLLADLKVGSTQNLAQIDLNRQKLQVQQLQQQMLQQQMLQQQILQQKQQVQYDQNQRLVHKPYTSYPYTTNSVPVGVGVPVAISVGVGNIPPMGMAPTATSTYTAPYSSHPYTQTLPKLQPYTRRPYPVPPVAPSPLPPNLMHTQPTQVLSHSHAAAGAYAVYSAGSNTGVPVSVGVPMGASLGTVDTRAFNSTAALQAGKGGITRSATQPTMAYNGLGPAGGGVPMTMGNGGYGAAAGGVYLGGSGVPVPHTEPTQQYIICFKCKRAIPKLDEGVMAANRFFHTNCFTCTRCQLGLAHVDFYNIGEFVFCTQCYLKTKKVNSE